MQINHQALVAGDAQGRQEPFGDLRFDHVRYEVLEGLGAELVAGDLALESPGGSVGVEDAVAEELADDGGEAGAFDVVGEVGVEQVADIGGVGGGHAIGEVEEGVDLNSGRWGSGELLGDPVVEAVAVAEESEEVSDYGMEFWRWGFGFGFGFRREEGESEEDESEKRQKWHYGAV